MLPLCAFVLAASQLSQVPVAAASPAPKAEAGQAAGAAPEALTPTQKDRMRAFSDGKGHLILTDRGTDDEERSVYYGDGKTFYRQRIIGFSADGKETFGFTFWEPRVAQGYEASISVRDGKATVQCEKRITSMMPVDPPERLALLAKATFFAPPWNRQAYALVRDDHGKYYYVDSERTQWGSNDPIKDFRLYIGPRGNVKRQQMVNMVNDSEGDIFATKSGRLRLVLGKSEAKWLVGKKQTKLILLPIEDNHTLIYGALGVYAGQPLGTPCDDL